MTKATIRDRIRAEKKKLTREQMEAAGVKVSRTLAAFQPYLETELLYCYSSYNQELSTKSIIRQALLDGKKVALPKVEGENIRFYIITDVSQVSLGFQKIPEPNTTELAVLTGKKPALMLLPGLAFTKEGDRLGYGGGFYDRFLSAAEEGALITCGLGYDFQVLREIPVEKCDQSIEYVMTPMEVYKCKEMVYK